MIQQAVRERHRKNEGITGLEPKSQHLAMVKLTVAQNGSIQPHATQIAMLKNTAGEIKIGKIGPTKINVGKYTGLVFTRLKGLVTGVIVFVGLVVLVG